VAIRLLCPHILPTIPGHNISGKISLVRDPTRIKTYKSPSVFQGVMSEADTMRSVVIVQVMQNAEAYHDIRISESRVVPKRLRIAEYKSSLAAVPPFGGSNISTIDIESEVLDIWEPR
jgi:hypothetical protein